MRLQQRENETIVKFPIFVILGCHEGRLMRFELNVDEDKTLTYCKLPLLKKKKMEAPQSPRLTTSPNESLLSSFLRFIFPPHSFLCFISCTVILSTKSCCSRGIRAVSSTLWRLAVSCSPWGTRRPRLSFRQIWGHCRRSGTISTVCCSKDWSSPRL